VTIFIIQRPRPFRSRVILRPILSYFWYSLWLPVGLNCRQFDFHGDRLGFFGPPTAHAAMHGHFESF
jgi:hypothetical protein